MGLFDNRIALRKENPGTYEIEKGTFNALKL